ncbi:MAG: TetR/AcrR family transcriptional regulator [Actinomycetes bacterium]
MPKIDAPTVEEHHNQRRVALLAAGAQLLAEQGVDAVNPAAVGAATGLARSSVYQYFDSAPALLAAVVEDAFPRANERLHANTTNAGTARQQVDAYVSTALDLAADRTHRALYALTEADLPDGCRARLMELHAQQSAPLLLAVTGLGVPEAELTTALLIGMLNAAARTIIEGSSPTKVKRRTLALIHNGLSGNR